MMIRGLGITRTISIKPPNQIGVATSQDRLSLLQGFVRHKSDQSGHAVATLLPGFASRERKEVNPRTILGPARPGWTATRPIARLKANAQAKLLVNPLRDRLLTGITAFQLRKQEAQAAAAMPPTSNAGLPSGRGTPENPIEIPGTTTTATSGNTKWFLLAGGALLLYLVVRG